MAKKIHFDYFVLVALLYAGSNATASMYTSYLLWHGLEMADVFRVRIIYYVTMMTLVLPMGIIADWVGRRILISISCVLCASSKILYAGFDTFQGFVFAELLDALGQACALSICASWYVDRIDHHRKNGAIEGEGRMGRSRFDYAWFIQHFASAAAGGIGGALADHLTIGPWLLASLFFIIGFSFTIFRMKEEYRTPAKFSEVGLQAEILKRARMSLQYALSNKHVLFVALVVFIFMSTVTSASLMWQPLFSKWSQNELEQGLIWVLMSGSLMLGATIGPGLVVGVASERKAVLICCIIVAAGMALTVCLNFPAAFYGFYAYQSARGAFGSIKDQYLHDSIGGQAENAHERRAALAAIETFAYHAGGLVGLLVWGVVAPNASIQAAWLISAAGLLSFVIIAAMSMPRFFKITHKKSGR